MNKIHPTPRIQLSAPAAAAPPIESMSVPIFDILSMGGAAAAAAGADRGTIWLDMGKLSADDASDHRRLSVLNFLKPSNTMVRM